MSVITNCVLARALEEVDRAGGHGFTGACGRLCRFGYIVRLHVLDLASLIIRLLTELAGRSRFQIGFGE